MLLRSDRGNVRMKLLGGKKEKKGQQRFGTVKMAGSKGRG